MMARIAIIENGIAVNVIEAAPGWKPDGDNRLYVETEHGCIDEAYDPKTGFERDRLHRENPPGPEPEPEQPKPSIEDQLADMRAEIETLKSAITKG